MDIILIFCVGYILILSVVFSTKKTSNMYKIGVNELKPHTKAMWSWL